jgi:hypothetical protein
MAKPGQHRAFDEAVNTRTITIVNSANDEACGRGRG